MVASERDGVLVVAAGAQNLDLAIRQPDQALNHTKHASQNARVGNLSCLRQLKKKQLVDFSLPMKLRPAGEVTARDQSRLAVAHAEC